MYLQNKRKAPFPAPAEKSPEQLETTGFWAHGQGSGDIYNLKRVGVPNKLLYSFSITSLSKATASSERFSTQNACFSSCWASIVSFSHPGWGRGRGPVLPFGRNPAACSLAAAGVSWPAPVVSEGPACEPVVSELPERLRSRHLCESLGSLGFACKPADSRSTCRSEIIRKSASRDF